MKRINFVLTISILLSSSATFFAQKLKFEQLGIRNGLPSTEVYSLFEDKFGYVWSFTEYGIVKHNGSEFVPVCKNIPISELAVYAVCENHKGEMFMANSRNNIYKIHRDSAFALPGSEQISKLTLAKNQVIPNVFVDKFSNIYFSTFSETYFYDAKKKQIVDLTARYSKKYAGIIYKKIGDDYVLIKLNTAKDKKQFFTILNEAGKQIGQYPFELNWGQERNFIRKTKDGFYFLSLFDLNFINHKGELKKVHFDYSTLNLEVAPNGRIWVGLHSGGLCELDENLKIVNTYLENTTVSDILFDRQSGMWVSTIEKGIHYCKNSSNAYFENIPALSGKITLIKKIGNRLFVGTANGHLFVANKKRLREVDIGGNQSFLTDIIQFQNHFFLGTKTGMIRLDLNLKFIENVNTNKFNCYSMAEAPNDGLYFIASTSINTYFSDREPTKHTVTCKPRSIIKSSKNDYLVGSNRGLFVLGKTFYIPKYLKRLREVRITQLRVDQAGNSWICTLGKGLFQLTPTHKLIHYPNIPSEVVNDICFISAGRVLLSTNKGLYINDSGDLAKKTAWELILDDETITAVEFNDAIFSATKQGLISFNRKSLTQHNRSKFYLESVVANGLKINTTGIQLNHKQNDLYFNFDYLAYQFPDKKMAYVLTGGTKTTGSVRGTQIHLQNLNPGNYKLVVRPLSVLNSKQEIAVNFNINPAFYQTSIFYLLVIIGSIVLILTATIITIKQVNKKKERKAEINTLLSEYKLIALKAQINPHFISNSLAAIQQLITLREEGKANQYIAKFSLLIRYVLNYSDKWAVPLKRELEIIDLNVDLEQLRFGNKIEFKVEIDPEVDVSALYIPPLITQPFIENAIWHGLLPLKNERAAVLVIKLTLAAEEFKLSICDNGVGRNFNKKQDNSRESKGISIINSRMETLNELYATNGARIEFIDLHNDHLEPRGTQVDIIFPISILENLYDDKNKERYY